MNEINFLIKMNEIIKISASQCDKHKDKKLENKMKPTNNELYLENVKLYKENQILKEKVLFFEHNPTKCKDKEIVNEPKTT